MSCQIVSGKRSSNSQSLAVLIVEGLSFVWSLASDNHKDVMRLTTGLCSTTFSFQITLRSYDSCRTPVGLCSVNWL